MFIFRKTESSYGKKMAKNGRITAIYFETNANAKIVKANNSFFVPSSQILVKKGLLRKTKSKNFQYFFHSKWKKCLRKIQTLPSLLGNAISDLEMAKPSEILASTTDSEAWNIEVERVAPKLKVTVRVDGRDWRSHLEQVSNLFVTSKNEIFKSPIVQFTNLKCCMKGKEPFKTLFIMVY